MKKILLALVIALLVGVISVQALETVTYVFTTSSQDTIIPITTYRTGDIFVSATYKPASHGMYVLWIFDENDPNNPDLWRCYSVYDFRWDKFPTLPQTCLASVQPAGKYAVAFRAAMGGKVKVTLDVTAETNP